MKTLPTIILVFAALAGIAATVLSAELPDLIIRGGRVVDGTGNPAVFADLAVADGRITAIGRISGDAKTMIDAKGLVVAPGFIDLHAHGQDDENYRIFAMDGVTTALELEVGVVTFPGSTPAAPARR